MHSYSNTIHRIMPVRYLIALLASASIALSATVDLLIDFEGGSHGDTQTTTLLNSVTYGTGANWFAQTAENTVTTNEIYNTPATTEVRGDTTYDTTAGTRANEYDHNSPDGDAEMSLTAQDDVSMGFFMKTTTPTSDYGYHDIFYMEYSTLGQAGVAQLYNSGGNHIRPHTTHPTRYGVNFGLTNDKWYWITMLWARNDSLYMRVYDPDDWSPVLNDSASEVSTSGLNDIPLNRFKLGDDSHSVYNDTRTYIDNIMFDWTTAEFPLLPVSTNTIYTVKAAGGGDYTTISGAEAVAVAGDIVEVYDGTYTESVTCTEDGTSDAWITFRAADGNSPVMTGGWNLDNRDYIEINGFTMGGGISGDFASNIKILNNVIDGVYVGVMLSDTDDVLISGNSFTNMTGDAVRFFGDRCVVRNNIMMSEIDAGDVHMDFFQSWCDNSVTAQYVLIENNYYWDITGNNVHFALVNSTSSCGDPAHHWIVRYNQVADIGSLGVYIDNNNAASGQTNNVIYNNTWYALDGGSPSQTIAHVMNASPDSAARNNLYQDAMYWVGVRGVAWTTGGEQSYNLYYDSTNTMTFTSPASGETGAVKNQDPLLTDPDNYDFSLGVGSPAIDAGGPLTTVAATDTGTGTSLIVEKAEWFQPGWGGAEADTIAVGTVNNTVQIASIDYSTDTITLSSSISRNDGDSVWLYEDSSGVRVLYGDGPDIGAVETSTTNFIYGVSSGTPGTNSATITWSTTSTASSGVEYGETVGYGSTSTNAPTEAVTSHSVTITGLDADTLYHYRVWSDAGAGAESSDDATFTTAAGDVCVIPVAGVSGGNYIDSQSVTLSTETSGATIYYTTDGSTPDSGDTAYTTAITISATTTLKAIAIKAGATDSSVMTEAYDFGPWTTTSGWQSISFTSRSGQQLATLSLTVNGNSMDAGVGLSDGTISAWSDMGYIVLCDSSGFWKARNGASYAYDTEVAFTNGATYSVEMDIDQDAETYDVYVTPDGGSRTQIADDYSIRTDQIGMGDISELGFTHDTSDTLTIESVTIEDNSEQPPQTSTVATATNLRIGG